MYISIMLIGQILTLSAVFRPMWALVGELFRIIYRYNGAVTTVL